MASVIFCDSRSAFPLVHIICWHFFFLLVLLYMAREAIVGCDDATVDGDFFFLLPAV